MFLNLVVYQKKLRLLISTYWGKGVKSMSHKKMKERIDFSNKVRGLLFKRAGGMCSVPRCKNPTMGPFYRREEAINMGVACHIFSAAENGPRGRGGKDDEFIRSEKNGIWCCSYHADLIDKYHGIDYPSEVLFAWKDLAEARTIKKMNDIPSPLGWVDSIKLLKFPGLSHRSVTLSRFTLLHGRNASGKTALMEMAASITNSKYAERFIDVRAPANGSVSPRFCAEVSYTTVDTLSKDILLQVAGGGVSRLEGGVRGLLPPGDLEMVFSSSKEQIRRFDEDDIDLFLRVLNVDKSALYSLVNSGGESLFPCTLRFQQAQEYDDDMIELLPKTKQEGDPYYELICSRDGRHDVSYDCMSGSEQGRLLLDFLIRKAREICKQRLTILLIDGLSSRLDGGNFKKLLTILSKEDFQVCVCLAPIQEEEVLELSGASPVLKKLDYLQCWQLRTLPDPSD